MAEEPRPLMYEVGVEGNRFHPHLKTVSCGTRGCIPVTPSPDDAADAAIGLWLLARMQREACHPNFSTSGAYGKWSLYLFDQGAHNIREAIQIAMAYERRPPLGLWHAQRHSGIAVCGGDEPNQWITDNPHHVTCQICLAALAIESR